MNIHFHIQRLLKPGNWKSLSQLLCKARDSSLYNNAFFLMLNTVCTSVLSFVFWNIMARNFSQTDVGIGSALNAACGLVSSIAGLGLGFGLVRFLPEMGNRATSLLNSAFPLAGPAATAGSVIYLLGIDRFNHALNFLSENYWLGGFFILFTIGMALSGLIDQSLIAARSAGYVFWKNFAASLLKLPLPLLLFASLKGYGIFAGAETAIFIALLMALLLFLPRVYKGYYPRPQWVGNILKKVLPFSFSNYLSGLLGIAPGYIYPLMILNILGPEQNAYFYMAWMIALVIAIIPGSLSQSLFAEGSHQPERLRGGGGRRALLIALLLTIPAVGIIFIIGGWLLHFFGPAYAENGAGVLRILTISVIPLCVNYFFMTVNQIKKRVSLIIAQSAFLACTSILLGYWLLGRIGIEGVGLAYLLSHFLLAVIVFWPLWKELRGEVTNVSSR